MRKTPILILVAAVSSALVGCGGANDQSHPLSSSGNAAAVVKKEAPRKVAPLQHGQAVPDVEFVNQDGRKVKLSDYRGKIVIMTFIYTRCNLPTMCPMITAKFKEAQEVIAQRKLSPVQFVTISFDVNHDKPEALKEFAGRYRAEFSNWDFVSGKAEEIGPLARALSVYYRQDQEGVFDHNIITAIIDGKGIFRDDFFGAEWDVKEFIAVVESLVKENK